MSKHNLKSKLATLLNDIEDMERSSKIRVLNQFIESELGLMEEVRYWDLYAVNAVHSRAIQIMVDLNPSSGLGRTQFRYDSDLARAYCFVQATHDYMRGEGLMPYRIGLKEDGLVVKSCEHRGSEKDSEGKYQCPDCDEEVMPILWTKRKVK